MSELGIPEDGQPVDSFVTIPDVAVQPESQRTRPNQIPTGVARGTQTYVNPTDGSYMTLGLIPDNSNQFGIAFFDSSGFLISKIVGTTRYIYDKTTSKNVYQDGKLPDGSYGFASATTGKNVSDGIS